MYLCPMHARDQTRNIQSVDPCPSIVHFRGTTSNLGPLEDESTGQLWSQANYDGPDGLIHGEVRSPMIAGINMKMEVAYET